MHRLDGAYLRVERAGEHLADLESRISAFINTEKDKVPFEFNTDTCQIRIGVFEVKWDTLWDSWRVLIGEIIYNLRAALDYLIYELALLDSGAEQQGTQFPIEHTPQGFNGRRNSFLKGLSVKHITSIEVLQPYNGTTWAHLLALLSNPDKHRHLTPVVNLSESRINISAHTPGELKGVLSHVYRTKNAAGELLDMQVETDFALHVTLSDGTPIVETLQQLQFQVRNTLDAFKSEFK
jgi:hypothetical protein